ncbi:MAG: hypothetical protein ABEI31_05530 [Halodesulfurarchaeum sp.]
MNLSELDLQAVGIALGYGLLGLGATAVIAFALLPLTVGIQQGIYHLLYLRLGPSAATRTAILTHGLTISVVAVIGSTLIAHYVSTRQAALEYLGRAVGLLVAPLVLFLLASFAGLGALLVALGLLLIAILTTALLLRIQYGIRSGANPALIGSIVPVVLIFLLLGFGIGWGWGYVITAREVPDGAANGTITSMEEVPEIREDLFRESFCSTDSQGFRRCYLQLRGYEHERRAAQFLAAHDVRCRYQNAPAGDDSGSVLVSYNGSIYRVGCQPHGD